MPPAARIGDMHTCPMVTPGVPPVPHVGGPILPPGCPTVLIGGQPAARATDMCTCVGPPDAIAMGSPTVLIGNLMAARMGDPTVHGGVIILGCPTVDNRLTTLHRIPFWELHCFFRQNSFSTTDPIMNLKLSLFALMAGMAIVCQRMRWVDRSERSGPARPRGM